MTEEMNEARSSSRLLRWAIGGFIFVLVLLGAYGTYRFALNQAVANRLQAIRDSGEPATWSEVVALYPPPAVASDNAAVLLREAAAGLVELDEAVMQRIPTFSDDAELPALNEPIPPEMLEAMGQYVAANDRAFELVAEAGQRPEAWYGHIVEHDNPFDILLPHLVESRRLTRSLQVAALWHAERDERDEAMAALHGIITVAESLRDDPILVSQLVRVLTYAKLHETLQRALTQQQFEDEPLRRLAEALEPALVVEPWTMALVGERAGMSKIFSMPVREAVEFSGSDAMTLTVHRLLGTATLDHLAYLDMMEQFIDATRQDRDQILAATERTAHEAEQLPDYTMTAGVLVPALEAANKAFLLGLDKLEAMRVALAIERYRLAEGALLATLEALVPTYLDAVPIGAFDGLPLVYERLPDGGYMLHSEDRNGGRERFEVRR